MRVHVLMLGVAFILGLALIACQQPTPTPAPTATPTTAPSTPTATPVPPAPTATPTVTWTNQDSVTHTVTADSGAFNSVGLAFGQSFSYTFTTPGTYAYHCTPHSNMKGTVTVIQSGTPSSSSGTSSGGGSDYY